jgi:hypothetical protein
MAAKTAEMLLMAGFAVTPALNDLHGGFSPF